MQTCEISSWEANFGQHFMWGRAKFCVTFRLAERNSCNILFGGAKFCATFRLERREIPYEMSL